MGTIIPIPPRAGSPRASIAPRPSFFRSRIAWSDADWRGVAREDLVIYELHVGTFTPEGTLDAIAPALAQLAALGITAMEIMPVAQFPGDRNWGYDGVHPYAVQNSYGGPRALQRLVDAAHRAGLAVILDVVYNHLGPEGNYLGKFGPYFTDRYHTPWGNAINFDGADSDAVRQFFVDNACAWVRDFHLDGLRLDAVQTIYDFSPRHILADIQAAVQQEGVAAAGRAPSTSSPRATRTTSAWSVRRSRAAMGWTASGATISTTASMPCSTGDRDGYYLDFGRPADWPRPSATSSSTTAAIAGSAAAGTAAASATIDRTRFVVCVQNHDQVGNHGRGDRLARSFRPPAQRLACGLLLLSPCVPLLFMGEEYGEERPFPFFCSFGDRL